MKKLLVLPAILFSISCATSVSTKLAGKNFSNLNEHDPVIVLTEKETLPENSEFIGYIKVGDSGFTIDCGYIKVIEDATASARKAGANFIQIEELKEPDFLGSTCYRLKAKIYRNLNPVAIAEIKEFGIKKNRSRLPEDSDYALIYFYRPKISVAVLGSFGYKIKNEKDSVIGRVRGGEKFVYKNQRIWCAEFFCIT